MKIRRLTGGDDVTAAAALLCRFFAEEGFATDSETIARHCGQMAALETCGLFIAEDGNQAVAVATVSLEFGIEYGWWAEMGDLSVVPECRGQGLSRRMVAAIEEFLRERRAAGFQVTVTPYASEHHDLASCYRRLGFESEGRLILLKRLPLPVSDGDIVDEPGLAEPGGCKQPQRFS